jgi:two-component system LytT family sensor kinase
MFKQLNSKLKNEAARIEFWIVMGLIAASLLFNIIDIVRENQSNYISNPLTAVLFNHLIIFVSYLLLCFYVIPAFETKQERVSNTLFVFTFIAACFIVGIINIYFAALLAIKILFVFFNRNTQNREHALYYETALLTASGILTIVALFYVSTPTELKYYAMYDMPAAMIVYLYAVHRILPRVSLKKLRFLSYFARMLLMTVLSTLIMAGLCYCAKDSYRSISQLPPEVINQLRNISVLHSMDNKDIVIVIFGNFLTQLIIVTPTARNVYKSRNEKKDEEIKTLKTELGKSDANLNFLKSQINPHFLFNALNTLYGTALQENAERTGEGIQKLGDMMRFMLQENTQDKILLSRDIDYLKNYILLQKLRVSTSSTISIETQIEDYADRLMIAPMLLIPFVENAFKHGISLLNPSHIKVTLQTNVNTLYFDVHNSIHIRGENDPEKGQSGIGLENVKQRLTLLYPNKHDLVIRENAKEFFIHLTLQLDINN